MLLSLPIQTGRDRETSVLWGNMLVKEVKSAALSAKRLNSRRSTRLPKSACALERLLSLLEDSHGDPDAVEGIAAEAVAEVYRAGLHAELGPRIADTIRLASVERRARDAPAVIGRPPGLPDWETALGRKQRAIRELRRWLSAVQESVARDHDEPPEPEAATPRVSALEDVLQPADVEILRVLASAGTTLLQEKVADNVQLSVRTVSKRLAGLRQKGFTSRPKGNRGGDAITPLGLSHLKARPSG